MRVLSWRPIVGCSPASTGCVHCKTVAADRSGVTRLIEARLAVPAAVDDSAIVHVCDHGDLFHDATPDDWINRVFDVMEALPRHQFLILTKRARRMHDYVSRRAASGIMAPHLWFGISAERQKELDERAPWLLSAPVSLRYLTLYPLLEPLDLAGCVERVLLVCAGEEPQRPADPAWFVDLERQCTGAGVPFQTGAMLDAA